ncbi:hypothetical protein KZ810_00625 [Sphingomonas sp. RHCKR47]|jgi:hypothetical protein|uniref:hypothetical protein n=1 Tax=Sphingomonas citricola TaxID=2862498 RepID=UPI001CA50728|nr:hypothetical protein [Sphingomonas citricola]MBW6521990.1 hypothetical protein [Sphingomonas citricola]
MDLNYLLHRHQVSLMRALAGDSSEARHAHRGLAHGYGTRIAALRATMGAAPSMLDRVS